MTIDLFWLGASLATVAATTICPFWFGLRVGRRYHPPTLAPALRASTAYRTLAASDGEKAADGALVLAREAVAAERARVLAIVGAVDGASNCVEVERACKAIRAGVEGGAK